MLPIHYACAYGATVEVLTVLIEAWEDSMSKKDAKGRTPLHFAMGNADRENSPKVVELLLELSPGGINALDSEKNLPLHLLSTKAESVDEEKFEEVDAIAACLDHYLKAEPKASIPLLTGIQNMPEWLRDIAVVHPTVQTMLNVKISSRFPTMILMLDCYFLIAVIAVFSVTVREALSRRYNPQNETAVSRSVTPALLSPLFIGALYFLGREITQMVSVRAQTTVLAYLADSENLLNLLFVFLTTYYTILTGTGGGSDDRYRVGAAVTLAFQYMQVLAYLKSIMIDFAVFVSGVVYVLTHLVAFMVCMMITVAAFGQIWFTLFRQSVVCVTGGEDDGANEVDAMLYGDDFYYADEPQADPVEDCEPDIGMFFTSDVYFPFLQAIIVELSNHHLILSLPNFLFRFDWRRYTILS